MIGQDVFGSLDITVLGEDGDPVENVCIAALYLGYPRTASRLVFYTLHKLKKGDELVLKDGQGQPYEYRVSEKLEVEPNASWVTGQVRNRDIVALQTCNPSDSGKRLMVPADTI